MINLLIYYKSEFNLADCDKKDMINELQELSSGRQEEKLGGTPLFDLVIQSLPWFSVKAVWFCSSGVVYGS